MRCLKQLLKQVMYETDDWRVTLMRDWPEIVGTLHTKMRIERFDQRVLIIGVYDSHWMQELFLLSRVIVKKMNQWLGKEQITGVRFVLASKYQFSTLRLVSKDTSVPLKPIHIALFHERALATVKDEALQGSLKSFLIRCLQP